MAKNKKLLASYRLLFGLLGLSAIVTEMVVLVNRGTFIPANFFSFFTVESNIFAAAVLLIGAVMAAKGKSAGWLALLRGAATLYMVTTGIVFAVLLSGLEAQFLTAVPWDNTVLHYIMPFAVLVDWLLDPPHIRIGLKQALWWFVYPVAYLAYTLIRGPIANWYPYPFLNPDNNGYAAVFVVCLGVAATILIAAWIIARLGRRTLARA